MTEARFALLAATALRVLGGEVDLTLAWPFETEALLCALRGDCEGAASR